VPGGEGRVDPLDDRHGGSASARDPAGDRREPLPERRHQLFGLRPGAGVLADGEDRGEHLVKGVRIKGDDLGGAAEVVRGLFDVAGGQGADAAQVLGEDEVRGERGEGAGVHVYKSSPAASRARM
jgi:hypothetical protein